MRILKYALRNIIRNPLLSLSSIFVIALLVFFVNVLLSVLYASEKFIASVNNRISFTISFQSGYTVRDTEVRSLVARLQDAFSGARVEVISQQDALAILKLRNPDLVSLIENTGENPLPDSLRIDNIPRDQYEHFHEIISESRDIILYSRDAMDRKLLDYESQFQRANFVVRLLRMLEFGVYALLGLFVFTVAVIIYSVVGNSIFFHRDEIEIIELVGGKPSFIHGPFLLQGAIYGFVATLFAGLVVMIFSRIAPVDFVSGPLTSIHSELRVLFWGAFPREILIFLLLGTVSAYIALSRYVRI